jgi:cell division septation protein DedD
LQQAADEAGDDVELANRARYYLQRCTTPVPAADTAPTVTPPRTVFAIQVAAVSSPEAADAIMQQVHAAGYEPRVVREDDLLKVRVGRFRSRDEARRAQADLRAKLGGSPFLVEESR